MASLNCSKCGAVKEGSYVKESWCGKCVGERRKKRIAERRASQGLPVHGSGRDPKCKKCGTIKESGYEKGAWCRACKCAHEKIRYEAKKLAEGSAPRRSGRNPICVCGITKENPDEAFCTKCNNERKRQLRLKKKQDPEFLIKERAKTIARLDHNFQNRVKKNCREQTHRYIAAGILIKQPCEVCGTNEEVQAHHDDYMKPLEVRWLCSGHHAQHHRDERRLKKLDKENK